MARTRLSRDPIDVAADNWRTAGWPEAAGGMALVTSVMRVQQLVLAQVERELKPFGLTFARYEVLMLLRFSRRGSLPVGKVGQRLQVHPASVTNAVDRLERDGLVERAPNPRDGRSVLVAITEEGVRCAEQATVAVNEVFRSVPLSGAQVDDLYGLLRELRHRAGDFA